MTQEAKQQMENTGSKLLSLLTSDQIRCLLNAVADAGYLSELDNRLRSIDPDLADTIRRIIQEPSTVAVSVLPSSQKTVEIWKGLWANWENRVMEVGNEGGDYVNHEEHWHPPYFDYSIFVNDLEEAANPMLEWIDRAFELIGEPELFLDSLSDISENIQLYPDWYQELCDRVEIGPKATACVLHWTWLGKITKAEAGRKLVDVILELDDKKDNVGLDYDACFQFFSSLPNDTCREIHGYLKEPQFNDKIALINTVWHRVYHEFTKRFDPSSHLQACDEHLHQDWRYGEPLIDDALARRDYKDAESFISRTLSSLLQWGGDEPWLPESVLLPEPNYPWNENTQLALEKLLDQWESAAKQLGKNPRTASLRLQRAIIRAPEDWQAVLTAFRTFLKESGKKTVGDRLLAEWRTRIVKTCKYGYEDYSEKSDTWVQPLIDTQIHPESARKTFIDHLEAWLECCQAHGEYFKKNWKSLALLTRVLPRYSEFQSQYPGVHSLAIAPAARISVNMEKSLRDAFVTLDDAMRHIHVAPIWERQFHVLIPSPNDMASHYRVAALWMKALSEINTASYNTLLARWRTEYGRRRNLWKDMAAVGCPGC